jgi:hypothetical protein
MGFWSKLFGGDDSGKGVSHQLPSTMVAQEFGEVNVKKAGKDVEVLFTILMEPTGTAAEGWQTGVALDGSGSMQGVFGRGLEPGPKGSPPDHVWEGYVRRNEMQLVQHQGQTFPILSDACKEDLVKRGHFVWSENVIEPIARRFTAYLASNLDADGGTTVIYWACGDGTKLEEIGDLTATDCERQKFPGPLKSGFGDGTFLTPAVRYFADRFKDASNGMYLFVTDGELNDLEDVKKYTIQLCREIANKRRNPLKCVLIGVGDQINEDQMEQLDDLDSGTDVDVWDHKIAKDMRNLVEIFAEVVGEHQIVAPMAKIYDSTGAMVKNFTDGMPARVSFTMPATSTHFEVEVGENRIKQSMVLPKK